MSIIKMHKYKKEDCHKKYSGFFDVQPRIFMTAPHKLGLYSIILS